MPRCGQAIAGMGTATLTAGTLAAAGAWDGAWLLRVSRWTKWYGGQGPDICFWHYFMDVAVVAKLFW